MGNKKDKKEEKELKVSLGDLIAFKELQKKKEKKNVSRSAN